MSQQSTILGGIAKAIDDVATGWGVEIGFSNTADEWVAENRSKGRTILVTHDSDEAARMGEERVRSFRTYGSIYMRARADVDKFTQQIWPTFKAIRAALNGLEVEEDGVTYRVTIGSSRAQLGGGLAIPSLQWTAE